MKTTKKIQLGAVCASLIAVPALAQAAQVTLYGVVDESLSFTRFDPDVPGTDKQNNFSMESGNLSGSRWGLKAAEDLGGFKVGFVLENGFSADTGKLGQGGRLFGRQSTVYAEGRLGKIEAGRAGVLASDVGTTGMLGYITPMGTSYGNYTAMFNSVMSVPVNGSYRVDNSVTYTTPSWGGFTARVQYAFGENGKENKPGTDRYAAAGIDYTGGPLKAVLVVDSINYDSSAGKNPDDSLTVTGGVSYDFGPVTAYAAAQYFKDVSTDSFAGLSLDNGSGTPVGGTMKGYGAVLSASGPVLGGWGFASAAWMDAESEEKGALRFDYKRLVGSVGYIYSLSKRTSLYGVLGAGQDKFSQKNQRSAKPAYAKALLGIRHKF